MIYDSHSHLGIDSFHNIPGNLELYIKQAHELGILKSNLMPVPSPAYEKDGVLIKPLIWRYEGKKFLNFRLEQKGSSISSTPNPVNPYKEINDILEKVIKEKNSNISLYFIPLVHPLLDSTKQIDYILSKNPRAIKIHGVACGIKPEQIPQKILSQIARAELPVIIHTDYYSLPDENNPLKILYRTNTAIQWLKLFEKHKIKGFITHGARLDNTAFEIINRSDLFRLGMSPDLLLGRESDRLAKTDSYLDVLLDSLDLDKICFDIDYPWNIPKREASGLEWGLLSRIKPLMSDSEFNQVTYKNATNFFG